MLARDINPSRLEKAKMMLSKLVDELDNDKVGLIVFAGDAYKLPITSDFVSAKMFLSSIDPNMGSYSRDSNRKAISLAMNSFTWMKVPIKRLSCAGLQMEKIMEHDAVAMAAEAAKKGIRVDRNRFSTRISYSDE